MVAAPVSSAWERFLATGDAASREELILQHTPLVKYVIGRLAIHLPQVLDFGLQLLNGARGRSFVDNLLGSSVSLCLG